MTICDTQRRSVALVGRVALAGLLHVTTASAQAEDQATARTLFNEARDLMRAGHYDQACPKLEAANKAYSGSGVLLNLGDCYEHLGRTASAWTEFGEAASAAERLGRSLDQAEAHKRQAALEPKLSRLAIRVSGEAPGLVVKRDGSALDRGAWGTAFPVDPGQHAVSAEASGYAAWSSTVSVDDPGKTVTIDVPQLQPAPASAVAPPPTTETTTTSSPAPATSEAPPYWTARRLASAAITGTGLAAMGAGGIIGLVAKAKFNTAKTEAQPAQDDDSKSALGTANAATVVVAVGAAVTLGGLVLWLTAPSAPVQVGTSGEGVLVRGVF